MLRHRSLTLAPAILGLTLALAASGPAQADFVVNVDEVGGDVVATGSGTINTTALTVSGGFGTSGAFIDPAQGRALFGPNTSAPSSFYLGINGPASFGGADSGQGADIGLGDIVGIVNGYLVVPDTYVSGSPLSVSDTWAGQTFASLGDMTRGTYVWTWGTGADADSFTMNIGTRSVPEPASLAMLATGSLMLLSYARRRRRPAD